ncbi:MAG TPA: 16S rRNA (cytosine(1402)-N(4))-methyltransferase RsmH [Dissulfurispiraceae bacterium]|nr:16S rRNA (cytosine(1402)-N(4))-methyltransferase RsmH [Dissulfurispiraceae bacterium]
MDEHIPVLLDEVMTMLAVKQDGRYIDATVGLGGHSEAILKKLGSCGRLLGLDRDSAALSKASERLGSERFVLQKAAFADMAAVAAAREFSQCDGILLDLGVSMMQLKDHERGFSFQSEHRLDMRMDPDQEESAWHFVNNASEADLERILREYGEEHFARRIVRRIVAERRKASIDTCVQLADVVSAAYGRRGKTHPATRTFQALRIAVNCEMEQLQNGLAAAEGLLRTGGRLCVLSYHSLEDRIVKQFMRNSAREGRVLLLTKKPIAASRDETRRNPAARSAKLRGCERL